METVLDKEYELPDRNIIIVNEECIKNYGLHQLAYLSISYCVKIMRKQLFNNIVLSAGNILFSILLKRIVK
eukprot:maker-scaffold_9-snap-gene-12.54-mRNA-1 protein AED:0.47 eAED:0.47 QI:0/0/0/1/0/0/2/0/70